MKEQCEFRLDPKFAPLVLKENQGKSIGQLGQVLVRNVWVDTDDPLYQQMREAYEDLRKQGKFLFYSWQIRRTYTKKEIAAAEVFSMETTSLSDQAGEEFGTKYDEQAVCPHCGAGAKQVSELWLNLSKLPKSDIARTIAGEWVVSERVKELFTRARISGIELTPVRHRGRSSTGMSKRYQMIVTATAHVAPQTKAGINPFNPDVDGKCRCPLGHVIGLNRLSEVHIDQSSWSRTNVASTAELVGTRKGLVRPRPLLLIDAPLHKLLKAERISGFKAEVAHLA